MARRDLVTGLSTRGETRGGADREGKRSDERDPRRPGDPPWRERVAHRHLPDELAVALRRARVSRGWSLRRAAEVTEVSAPHLHHLEAGTRWPSVIVAELLISRYRLDAATAVGLRAVARPNAGRSSPYRAGW